MERIGNLFKTGTNDITAIIQEMLRIFPDGLILGIGLFSIVTLSFSYGVFFMSLLESLLIFHGLRSVNVFAGISRFVDTKASIDKRCATGFSDQISPVLSMFGEGLRSSFPSASIYVLSVAASYILLSLMNLSKELEIMGKEYSQRFYLAMMGLPLLAMFFVLYRLFYVCDSMGNILFSLLVGGLIGAVLVEQNRRVFGDGSLNLIGVPLLRQRTATGEKLYVCPTQSKL